MVFYRKYRPQTLDQIVGQEIVKKTLSGSFASENLSHAYLFCGPRGTGKTSTARILAKMVNCEKSGNIPCNSCTTCVSITDGSNLDLIEIDAASNRGIDDVRSLRENIKLSPASAKKKVYIIDEVHMLTSEAFNALLKTLEEPPEHALFILATTEANKIPQTIISRTQKLDFKIASTKEIIEALKRVVDGEKIKIDEDALDCIAKAADGSFRDGVKLLDQLAAMGGQIKALHVQEALQTSDFASAVSIIYALARKDNAETISLVLKQLERGVSPKNLTLILMEQLRHLVFLRNDLGSRVSEEVGSERYKTLVDLSERFSTAELIYSLDRLQKAIENLKNASITSLPLELALVEICGEEKKLDVRSWQMEKEVGNLKLENPTSNSDIAKLQEKWTFILETIRQDNFSLEALLRGVKIVGCSGGIVSIEVSYAFHQRILETPKSRDLLEAVLSDVLATPTKVSVVLGARTQRVEDIANVEVAADDEVISLASEIFNGKLVD